MEFKKFSSIENSCRIKFLQKMELQGLDSGEFYVTEKLHGSHLDLVYDGQEMKVAKRSGFINIGHQFFNWTKIAQDNYGKVKGIYNILKNSNSDIKQTAICGEIFGGIYPHPDIPKIPTATKVQKGIYYHPDNLFYAFDIRVNEHYINVEEANELFKKVKMFYAKTLFKGTLRECLEYPNTFQTKIPEWLNLPPIKDNICEGVVIRPATPKYLYNKERVILKNKNKKWSEKVQAKTKQPAYNIKFSNKFNKLYNSACCLITENRLRNVLSKFGQVTQKDFGKLCGLLTQDVIEEFLKDNQETIDSLEKNERKSFNKALNKETGNLIKKNFVNIIDGVF